MFSSSNFSSFDVDVVLAVSVIDFYISKGFIYLNSLIDFAV